MNGKRLSLLLTRKPEGLRSLVKARWTRPQSVRLNVRPALGLLSLGMLAMLLGCTTISSPPTSMPRNPEPPPSALPDSPPNWSNSVHDFLSKSRKALTELIQKPAN